MTERTRWEYSRIQVVMTRKGPLISVNGSQVSSNNLTDLLNAAGADGWELVGAATVVDPGNGEVLMMYPMKRPL